MAEHEREPSHEAVPPPGWTSLERAEFTKALLTRGVPLLPKTNEYDWELFRARLGAQRSGAELSNYYNTFLAFCRELVVRHSSTSVDTKGDNPHANKEGLSFETAKSIVLRLMFFFALRSAILPNPYLDHFLRSAPRAPSSFPSWWMPEHDRGLLIGVERYGLEDAEAICNDAQLPFKSLANAVPAAAAAGSQRITERLGFPPKTEVLKRVEALCKHVQLCSLHFPTSGGTGSPPSYGIGASPSSASSPAAARSASQSLPSGLMPPPISPARKEKRLPTTPTGKEEIKHQRTET